MRLPVKLNLAPLGESLSVIAQAIAAKAKPRNWRPSEYAMTKGTAQLLWDKLRLNNYEVEADYFDWSCLTGELARFYKQCRKKYVKKECEAHVQSAANALKVFSHIHTACMADTKVAALVAESQRYEKSKKKLDKYKRKVEAMEHNFRQRELEVAHQHSQLQRREP